MKQHKLGRIGDPRPQEKKTLDFQFQHLYSLVPINWIEKPMVSWRHKSKRNQDGAGSCVAHTCAECLEDKDQYSAHPIYSRRVNAPNEGMYPQNAFDILKNQGTTTESLDPSIDKSESDMNLPVIVSTPKKIASYGFVNIDMDQIAQAIDLHGAVALSLNLSWQEWSLCPGIPTLVAGAHIDGGHEVTGVEYTIYNGKKAIIAQNHWEDGEDDSYAFDKKNDLFIITEDYLKARCSGVGFIVPFPADAATVTITRGTEDTKETLGSLVAKVGGATFSCKTLELPYIHNQINVSCIPKGTYQCVYAYKPNSKRYCYQIQNVSGRTGIFIHVGNFFSDLKGCIALGSGQGDINNDGEIDVTNSVATIASFEGFMQKKPFTLIIQ